MSHSMNFSVLCGELGKGSSLIPRADRQCEAGTLVSSPLVILKVESFTRSQRRGDVLRDRFFGLNSAVSSMPSKAGFGFSRPGRYLRPFSAVEPIFRCACRHL